MNDDEFNELKEICKENDGFSRLANNCFKALFQLAKNILEIPVPHNKPFSITINYGKIMLDMQKLKREKIAQKAQSLSCLPVKKCLPRPFVPIIRYQRTRRSPLHSKSTSTNFSSNDPPPDSDPDRSSHFLLFLFFLRKRQALNTRLAFVAFILARHDRSIRLADAGNKRSLPSVLTEALCLQDSHRDQRRDQHPCVDQITFGHRILAYHPLAPP